MNEKSALKQVTKQLDAEYNAVEKSTRTSSVASLERRYSTARFMGIMIPKNFWLTLFWAACSVSASSSGVTINHILFKKLRFPLFSAQIIQMIVQILISIIFGLIFDDGREDKKTVFWPRFSWVPKIAFSLFLLAVCYIPRIYFTNAAIGNVQISTYQVLRQTAIIFSVILSWLLLGHKPTLFVCFACLVIFAGFALPAFDPNSLQASGILWGLAAGISSALYLVVIKFYLPVVDNDSRVLVNYNSTLSLFLLVPCALLSSDFSQFLLYLPFTEGEPAVENFDYTRVWMFMMGSALISFFINIASMMLVRYSSPVTYDVIGTFKTLLMAFIGFVQMKDSASKENIIGIGLSVVGSFIYGKARHSEHVAKVKADALEKKRLSMERKQKQQQEQSAATAG